MVRDQTSDSPCRIPRTLFQNAVLETMERSTAGNNGSKSHLRRSSLLFAAADYIEKPCLLNDSDDGQPQQITWNRIEQAECIIENP